MESLTLVDGALASTESPLSARDLLTAQKDGIYTALVAHCDKDANNLLIMEHQSLHAERLALSLLATAASRADHVWHASLAAMITESRKAHAVCCCHPPIPRCSILDTSEDLRKYSGWPMLTSALWGDVVRYCDFILTRALRHLSTSMPQQKSDQSSSSSDVPPFPIASRRAMLLILSPTAPSPPSTSTSSSAPQAISWVQAWSDDTYIGPISFSLSPQTLGGGPGPGPHYSLGISWTLRDIGPATMTSGGITATLVQGCRAKDLSSAKYSAWAAERCHLEAERDRVGADEALLCHPRDAHDDSGTTIISEGLLSNVFFVQRLHTREELGQGMTDKQGVPRIRLRTAGVKEGALPGVLRAKILQICRSYGIQVSLEAMDTAAIGEPKNLADSVSEIFVCNAVRGIRAVNQIRAGGKVLRLFDDSQLPGPCTRWLIEQMTRADSV